MPGQVSCRVWYRANDLLTLRAIASGVSSNRKRAIFLVHLIEGYLGIRKERRRKLIPWGLEFLLIKTSKKDAKSLGRVTA